MLRLVGREKVSVERDMIQSHNTVNGVAFVICEFALMALIVAPLGVAWAFTQSCAPDSRRLLAFQGSVASGRVPGSSTAATTAATPAAAAALTPPGTDVGVAASASLVSAHVPLLADPQGAANAR